MDEYKLPLVIDSDNEWVIREIEAASEWEDGWGEIDDDHLEDTVDCFLGNLAGILDGVGFKVSFRPDHTGSGIVPGITSEYVVDAADEDLIHESLRQAFSEMLSNSNRDAVATR